MSEVEKHYERRLKRHRINGVVEIYDSNRDQYLGRLVNIHCEGLMVMGEGLMQTDHVYQLDLQLPEVIGGSATLHLGVDCLWSRAVDASNTHWTGCHIIDLSDQARRQIDALIGQLSAIGG